MRHEEHNLHGTGYRLHEVYDMPPKRDYWSAVTGVPCPVEGCGQTVVWYESGYVPGYRACMAPAEGVPQSSNGRRLYEFYATTLRHRFLAKATADGKPVLVRDDCCE